MFQRDMQLLLPWTPMSNQELQVQAVHLDFAHRKAALLPCCDKLLQAFSFRPWIVKQYQAVWPIEACVRP